VGKGDGMGKGDGVGEARARGLAGGGLCYADNNMLLE